MTQHVWTAGIDPDVEWSQYPAPLPYETREEAIRAVSGAVYAPDEYGHRANSWVAPAVVIDGRVQAAGCTCGGQWYCSACELAKERLSMADILAVALADYLAARVAAYERLGGEWPGTNEWEDVIRGDGAWVLDADATAAADPQGMGDIAILTDGSAVVWDEVSLSWRVRDR